MQNTNSPSRALSFFDLPQELRNSVYMHVLETEIKPPRRPFPGDHEKNDTKRAYAVQPRDIASFGLLYTNRQTRYEMSHAIAHQSATEKDITYKLDCMLYRGTVIPTWTALPAPPCHLRHITVTVREFQSDGHHVNETLISPLIKLVNQFLERDYSWWGRFCVIPLMVDTLTVEMPYTDDRASSRFLHELATSSGLWRKVRKVRLPGCRQNREQVVIPSYPSGRREFEYNLGGRTSWNRFSR